MSDEHAVKVAFVKNGPMKSTFFRSQSEDGSLADASYWGERQSHLSVPDISVWRDFSKAEWFEAVERFLLPYRGARFLELGCSPGHVSALICTRVHFEPHGIDYSPNAPLYLQYMKAAGISNAKLFHEDIRTFHPSTPYDVVGSFGLVEHFADPQTILEHHDRLLKDEGLCIVVIPNFRCFQYAYHYFFDRTDLRKHNIHAMTCEIFVRFAKRKGHNVLFLGYCGRLRFWNVDDSGSRGRVLTRRILAGAVRIGAQILGRILPEGHPALAPWIVYVGRKGDDQ